MTNDNDDIIGTQLFVRLSGDAKKTAFKIRCISEGLKMKDVIERAVDEFIQKGRKACFLRQRKEG